MQKNLGMVVAFIASFILGSGATYFAFVGVAKLSEFVPPAVDAIEMESLPIAKIDYCEPPLFNPNIDYPNSLGVKLLQTGAYHADEVPYKTGERWLGLFREGHRYELRWTTIKNDRIDDHLFDREISISDSGSSVFLLRGNTGLEPGPVTTVFDAYKGEEFDILDRNSFGLKGRIWNLWIENADSDGFLKKGSTLLVQQNGFDPQVLRSLPDGCNDCGWSLLWVGDLDGDNSLDFLIDVSWHYNSYQPVLFTSQSGRVVGELGILSSFHGVGC